jgi:hypothetical protein
MFWGLPAALAVALLLPGPLAAQKKKPDDKKEGVGFHSFDDVELHGSFYPGSSRKSPTVLLLHELGGNSQEAGWPELARKLQDAGFAVLSFDFRGHGRSTNVGKSFWSVRANQNIRGANLNNPKAEIHNKDFPATYFPYLVNDIAAAKRYLDEQNDAQLCNSSNLILIGAKDGATLGALWAATEFQRPSYVRNQFNQAIMKGVEGEDITCCVWLSISQTLPTAHAIKGVAGYSMPVADWLRTPSRVNRAELLRDKVPVYLITNGNRNSVAFNDQLLRSLKAGKGKTTKFDMLKRFDDAKDLSGRTMLDKPSLNVERYISAYMSKVTEEWDKNWKDKGTSRQPGPLPVQYQQLISR